MKADTYVTIGQEVAPVIERMALVRAARARVIETNVVAIRSGRLEDYLAASEAWSVFAHHKRVLAGWASV